MEKFQLIEKIKKPEYDFLVKNEHLGNHICLLSIGGSYAYGTAKEDGSSDLDIRGIALKSKREILLGRDFEQVVEPETDTVIYSFDKIVRLLADGNPGSLELLGNISEHYIYTSSIGRELINNRKMFLSRKCIDRFNGYANQQLRRLENALARDTYPESEKERHILASMENTMNAVFKEYGDSVQIYMGSDDEKIHIKFKEGFDKPIRETNSLLSQMTNIVRDYEKLNHRNKKKDAEHLNKHAMHLIRLYLMGINILEKEEIITHRPGIERDFLMKIRNGYFQKPDGTYDAQFFEFLNDLQGNFIYAAKNTSLPEKPDMKAINDFVCDVNEKIILENRFDCGDIPFADWRAQV